MFLHNMSHDELTLSSSLGAPFPSADLLAVLGRISIRIAERNPSQLRVARPPPPPDR